jgi:hypothetical protein
MLIALLRLADRTGATRHERATQPALLIEVPSPGRWSRRSRGMAGTPACDSAKQIGSSHPSDGMMWRPQRRPRTEARHRRRDEVIRGLTPSGPLRKPCEIVRGVARPRGWPSWFRLCEAGFYSPRQRGGGAPTGAFSSQCTPCGESTRGMRVPFLFGKRTQRPSALRTALVGIGSHSRDGAFPACAGRTRQRYDGSVGVLVLPGRFPVPPGPRACKTRRRRRRTPLHLQLPPVAPSSERGCRTICSGK